MGISMVTFNRILYSKRPGLLILKYVVFAVISMIFNLGSQFVTDRIIDEPHDIFIALIVGTGVGLVIKYILDKHYIFFYKTDTIGNNLKAFLLYSAMGIITTGVFWGFELAFHYIIATSTAKYWGGLLGLAVGYTFKFFLDKKLVFRVK